MNSEVARPSNFNLKMLLLLSFGHMATDVCQSALPAILPFLKAKLLLSYTMTGVIMLASNITSSVIQPIFGYMSDQREKAFLLPLGCLFAGLGLSLLAISNNYEMALLLVVISGLGIAAYHPEGFKTARGFTGEKPATGLAVFTVGGNVGLALGPVAATFVIAKFGLNSLPLMLIFSLVFVALILFSWKSVVRGGPRMTQQKSGAISAPAGARLSLALLVTAVVMRSWTHFGLMAYIPFYYIDVEKGDPLFAGTMVSIFLAGGAVGTLLGSPLADRWGHKRYLIMSMAVSSLIFPSIFMTHGPLLALSLGILGMALISSFTVTMVMAQELLPNNLGIASGIMAGFAIGTGGIGVTLLGVIADHFGAAVAMKSIMLLPIVGLAICLVIRYPLPREH